MTVRDALSGAGFARSDAEVLLARILQKDRSWLLGHPEYALKEEERERWTAWSTRRRTHEPVAYILGEWEFYGRPFSIDRRALIPRPATEGIIRHALAFLDQPRDATEEVDEKIVVVTRVFQSIKPRVTVDVGTGSGCIAVTFALEKPDVRVVATDVSAEALSLAQENAIKHGVVDRVEFRQGDCLDPIMDLQEPFLLVSNPPYIPQGRVLMKDVADFEPHTALFGGDDGARIVRKIWQQAKSHTFCTGVVMECGVEHAILLA
jgi:release factor glutamine methyltransferase